MIVRITCVICMATLILGSGCGSQAEPINWESSKIEITKSPSASHMHSLTQPEGERSLTVNGGDPITVNWVRYEGVNSELSFSAPASWMVSDTEEADILLVVDSVSNDFFTLIINEKSDDLASAEKYVVQLVEDASGGASRNYSVIDYSHLSNRYRDVFYLQLQSNTNKFEQFFIVITEEEKHIFDFTMRSSSRQTAMASTLFNMVMHSFELQGVSIMGAEAELELLDVGWEDS